MSNLRTEPTNRNGYLIAEAIPEPLQEQLRALFRQESERLLERYQTLKPLMSIKDVARTLSVSPRTAETMLAAGELPPPLWIGGTRKWHPDSISAFIRAREKAAR